MKNKKRRIVLFQVLCLLIVCFTMVSHIYGISSLGGGFNSGYTQDGDKYITNPVNKIARVVIMGLQVASITGVIFAGVSYMFVSADQKAEIKKKLIPLCIGLVIVFAGSTFVGFVTGMFQELIAD